MRWINIIECIKKFLHFSVGESFSEFNVIHIPKVTFKLNFKIKEKDKSMQKKYLENIDIIIDIFVISCFLLNLM